MSKDRDLGRKHGQKDRTDGSYGSFTGTPKYGDPADDPRAKEYEDGYVEGNRG